MSDSFKIDSFPSTFKWLESTVSLIDQDEKPHSKVFGGVAYLVTIGCTGITIIADAGIGAIEAFFYAARYQDFSKSLSVLKRKWVEAALQETAFVVIGVITLVTELGDWQRSYRVTKCVVQELSERFGLGTPQIFNRIRYPIPSNGLPMPSSCQSQKEKHLFDIFNSTRSKFYKNLKAFKNRHKRSQLAFYGANNVLNRVRGAETPAEVMSLNVDSLKEKEVSTRLEDLRNVFAVHSQITTVQDILQVIISAHDALQAYLKLPFQVRKEIQYP